MVERFVEEAVFKFFEEERIQKAVRDALELSGVKESHLKKATKALAEAYDDAHFNAPYGTTQGATAALSLLQDFVKGWMTGFLKAAWKVLDDGTPHSGGGKEGGILFTTVLFQNLTDSKMQCLPHDITSLLENPIPARGRSWPSVQRLSVTSSKPQGRCH